MRFDLLLALLLLPAADPARPLAAEDWAALRLNQIQVVGTHNSYHLRPSEQLLKTLIAIRRDAKQWDYSRETLDQQLDRGIRSFELDLQLLKDQWHVMHVPTFDSGTTVKTLEDACRLIREWSNAHRGHVPISLLLELKEEGAALTRAIRHPRAADLDQIDKIVRDSFPPDRLITPDDVRGQRETLLAGIQAGNWPALSQAAGRVLCILHSDERHREAYRAGHPSLEGRVMFINSEPDQPFSATIVADNPADPRIPELAKQGYLIRTRVDSQGHIEESQRRQGLASGAHILSTDYPSGEIEADRAFHLPDDAPARVNPVTGPANLAGKTVREPAAQAENK